MDLAFLHVQDVDTKYAYRYCKYIALVLLPAKNALNL